VFQTPRPRRPADSPAVLNATPAIQVVCVDACELARLGVAVLARRYPDLRLVGEAGTLAEARELIARTRPAVVVIGDSLPDRGHSLAAELRAAHPGLGLVAVSHHTGDPLFGRARQAGMSAFVSRSAPATAVVAAIRHAAATPESFRTFGVPWAVEREVGHARALSPREQEVLRLLRDGMSAEDIAAALRVGTGTVRTHVSRLYAKLHVTNRSQAVVATADRELVGATR
jgi:DNA-binding NarL/FixJ family response regulator